MMGRNAAHSMRACSMHGGDEIWAQNCKDQDVEGNVILKLILKHYGATVQLRFVSL
jgi:hypothetical protein